MSLIHWWPLNGDTKDYGIGNIALTNNGNVGFDASGKIGKCAVCSTGKYLTASDSLFSSNKTVSISYWLKVNTTPSSDWADIWRFGSNSGYLRAEIYSGNLMWTGREDNIFSISGIGLTIGEWQHFSHVLNTENKTYTVYKNGGLVAQKSYTSTAKLIDSYILIAENSLDLSLNDFRIYNHALSAKEVKEISKGLVLHYNFEDPWIEGTTNLDYPTWSSYSDYWTVESQTNGELNLKSKGTGHGTVALNNSIVKSRLSINTYITVSGYLYINGVPFKCNQSSLTPYDGWVTTSYTSRADGYFSFSGTFSNLNDVWIIHTPLFDAPASGTICTIKNMQWEIKDHPTPYVPASTNIANTTDMGGWDNSGTATRTNPDTSFNGGPINNRVISILKTTDGDSCITFGNCSVSASEAVSASTYVYLTGNTGSVYLRSGRNDGAICYLVYNGQTDPAYWPKNTWIRITGTGTTASNETSCYLCMYLGNAGVKAAFNGWQIEYGNVATPVYTGTRPAGIVYDNSGYGYNANVNVGSCQILEDSASGEYSIYSPAGANYVERQNIPFTFLNDTQEFTITCWLKVLAYNPYGDWNTILRLAANNATDTQLHMCYDYRGYIILSQYADDPLFESHIELNKWCHLTWVHYKEGNSIKCKYYVNGSLIGDGTYNGALNIQANPRLTLFYDSLRDGYGSNSYLGDFKIYSTALSATDIQLEYNRKASIDKNGNLFAGYFKENGVNLLTTENLFNGRVNTSYTTNVGEIVTRNGEYAYRVAPPQYWAGEGNVSNNIAKGQFQQGRYVFDLWMDVDDVYYSGISNWVPGGLTIRYTDGVQENLVLDAVATQGHSGFQHLVVISNPNKTIYGLGVYYYVGTPFYIRCDSVICKADSVGKVKKNGIFTVGQFVDRDVSNFKLTKYGAISTELIEN